MQTKTLVNPVLRAVIIFTFGLSLITGVTYAALQSQVKMTGSTIQTATANLQLSPNGTAYSSNLTGYTFNSLVPGGNLVPNNGHPVYLKNAGGTPLSLKFAVSSTPTNIDTVDLSKVNVILNSVNSGQTQTFTLKSLIEANATGGMPLSILAVLFPGQTHQFTLQVSMAKDAFAGNSATIGDIDFVLTGEATN